MPSVLRSAAVFAAIFAVAVASMPGCSQQSEGERCDLVKNGDDDCDSGLVCVDGHTLLDQVTDRCCLPNKAVNDKRCTPVGVTGTGGTGGGTNGGGDSDSDAGGGGATSADGETPADAAGGAGGAPSPTGGTGPDSAGMSNTPGGAGAAAGAPSSAGAGG